MNRKHKSEEVSMSERKSWYVKLSTSSMSGEICDLITMRELLFSIS